MTDVSLVGRVEWDPEEGLGEKGKPIHKEVDFTSGSFALEFPCAGFGFPAVISGSLHHQ